MTNPRPTSTAVRVSNEISTAIGAMLVSHAVEALDLNHREAIGVIKGAHVAGALTDEDAFEWEEKARAVAETRRDELWRLRNRPHPLATL